MSDRGRNPFNGLFPLSKQNRIRLQPEECCRNWIGEEGENGVIVISKISFSRMAPFSGHPVRFCAPIENSRVLSAVTKWARIEFTFDEMPHRHRSFLRSALAFMQLQVVDCDTRFAIIPERLWYHISADTFTTETNTLAPDAPTLPTSVSMMGHIKVKTTNHLTPSWKGSFNQLDVVGTVSIFEVFASNLENTISCLVSSGDSTQNSNFVLLNVLSGALRWINLP